MLYVFFIYLYFNIFFNKKTFKNNSYQTALKKNRWWSLSTSQYPFFLEDFQAFNYYLRVSANWKYLLGFKGAVYLDHFQSQDFQDYDPQALYLARMTMAIHFCGSPADGEQFFSILGNKMHHSTYRKKSFSSEVGSSF